MKGMAFRWGTGGEQPQSEIEEGLREATHHSVHTCLVGRGCTKERKSEQPSSRCVGLAPVRSSKQDQIHASLVSTLLALMDGMDGRGEFTPFQIPRNSARPLIFPRPSHSHWRYQPTRLCRSGSTPSGSIRPRVLLSLTEQERQEEDYRDQHSYVVT